MAAPANDQPDGLKILRLILTDVRLVLVGIVAVFLGGFGALAQVQSAARQEAAAVTAGTDAGLKALAARQDAHELQSGHIHEMLQEEVTHLRSEVRETRQEVEGLRRDLRTLFPALPPPVKDAGP